MLKTLFRILKNLNPFKNFAKPIHGRTSSFSYEALTQDLAQEQQATPKRLEAVSSFYSEKYASSSSHAYGTYGSSTAEADTYEEAEAKAVLIVPKIEIVSETQFVVEPEPVPMLEAPLEPDALIGQLMGVHNEPEIVREHVEVTIAEVTLPEEQPAVIKEVEKAPKKTRARKVVPEPKAHHAPKNTRVEKKIVKKVVKKKVVAKRAPRKKNIVPPEAMGFGF